MKRSALYTIAAALAICMACSENDVTGGCDINQDGRIPLRLCVGNHVELQTRGTDTGLQNSTLAPGTRVGVFVMTERDYDSLRAGSAYHDALYCYDNVECSMEADGSLRPTKLAEMFYPMGQDMKVAVFAYAPYDKDMTREALLLPMESVSVGADQSSDDVVLGNDLLLGTPALANPLRMPVTDHASSRYAPEAVSLNLRHQRCRIVLDLKFSGTPELLDGNSSFRVDSMQVYVGNVPMEAPLGYSLDETMENYAVADSVVTYSLLMAKYTDVVVWEGQELSMVATGIVLPCPYPVNLYFSIVMYLENGPSVIFRRVASPVVLERGTSVSFRTTVEERR